MQGFGFQYCSPRSTSINSTPNAPFLSFLPLLSSLSFPFSVSRLSPRLSRRSPFSGIAVSRRLIESSRRQDRYRWMDERRLYSLLVGEEINQKKKKKMTITPAVRIAEKKLFVKDRMILSGVPDNVISTSAATSSPVEGIFVGAQFPENSSRHVISLGTLRDIRFLSCFRFKLWWMAQRMGDQGRDVPLETQFLLVETKGGSYLELADSSRDGENQIVYTVFLPLTEGPFRACLQGNPQDELELCLESGDSDTKASSFTHSLFISAGIDPFAAITEAIEAVKSHLKTFHQRHEKKLPSIVDYFGWCTWDAFYQDVTQEGVESGLQSLAAGGTPPKFVIIDDGWQSVGTDPQPDQKELDYKPLPRLTNIKENNKFQTKDDPSTGIQNIVKIAKEKYGLKYVYVWHAITGYWGGVRPGVLGMEQYGSKMQYPLISQGVAENDPGMKTEAMTLQGLGLVNPKNVYRFYNELHGYLASAAVDGVKVDVQCILETLGAGLGGRVQLTRQYHQALDASIAKNFPDNGCIACMSHNTDALYCSKQTAVVRASDDFFPRDPVSHTIHIAAVAYNSIFLGEFMQPDWDMFHSLHPAAEYHASARAISGGPIYVSDKPGEHNFELLKKLVLPDGSILRALLPGRPTRDCLFADPTRDGVSLLKIWNMNKYTGVLGVYNCQGAAWSSIEKKSVFHHTQAEVLSCAVRGRDVHLLSEASIDPDWNGDCIIYRHKGRDLVCLPNSAVLPVSLKVLEHEIFTISPIKVFMPGFSFAPLGLVDMFNAGGAIQGLRYQVGDCAALTELDSGFMGEANGISLQPFENRSSEAVGTVFMEVKGCGRLGAYSSAKPRKCLVGSDPVNFSYDSSCGLLTLNLDNMLEGEKRFHNVVIEV